jgi:hypothetical protein
VPRLVRAPQRGAFVKSPGGLLFFNQPRRCPRGSLCMFGSSPLPTPGHPSTWPARPIDHNGRPVLRHRELLVLHDDALRAARLELPAARDSHSRRSP